MCVHVQDGLLSHRQRKGKKASRCGNIHVVVVDIGRREYRLGQGVFYVYVVRYPTDVVWMILRVLCTFA